MSNYAISVNGPRRVDWVNPNALGSTLMESIQAQNKQLGQFKLHQFNTLIASGSEQPLPKPVGCADACVIMPTEKLSIRTTISGSAENKEALLILLASHIVALQTLVTADGALIGNIKRDAVIPAPDFSPEQE